MIEFFSLVTAFFYYLLAKGDSALELISYIPLIALFVLFASLALSLKVASALQQMQLTFAIPLKRLEYRSLPMDLGVFTLFPIVSFLLVALKEAYSEFVIPLFIGMLGILLSRIRTHIATFYPRLNPFYLIEELSDRGALRGIYVDVICRAIQSGNVALAKQVLECTYHRLSSSYLEYGLEEERRLMRQAELIQFIEAFTPLYRLAKREGLESYRQWLLSLLGKTLCLTVHEPDPIGSLPLSILKKLLDEKVSSEMQKEIQEIEIKVLCILQEVFEEIIGKYTLALSANSVLVEMILYLQTLSERQFKRNKSIPVAYLMQPFKEMQKKLMQKKENSALEPVNKALEGVLSDFVALEEVLQKMPDKGAKEKSS